jgi:hypothetical protein
MGFNISNLVCLIQQSIDEVINREQKYIIISIDLMMSLSLLLCSVSNYTLMLYFTHVGAEETKTNIMMLLASVFFSIAICLANICIQIILSKFGKKRKYFIFCFLHSINFLELPFYMLPLNKHDAIFFLIVILMIAIIIVGFKSYKKMLNHFSISPQKTWEILNLRKLSKDWLVLFCSFCIIIIVVIILKMF